MLDVSQHLFFPPHRALQPKAFIAHAASLRQAFAHCARFPLLPPVGVWTVSQFQCGCSSSQTSYPS